MDEIKCKYCDLPFKRNRDYHSHLRSWHSEIYGNLPQDIKDNWDKEDQIEEQIERPILEGKRKEKQSRKMMSCLLFVAILIGTGVWLNFSIRSRFRPSSYIESSILNSACQSIDENNQIEVSQAKLGSIAVSYEGSYEYNVYPRELGFMEADIVEDLETLICIDELIRNIEDCQYSNGTAFTRRTVQWSVSVIDWDSKNLIALKRITGATPRACPSGIGQGNVFSRNFDGDAPIGEMSKWLHELEE